MSSALPQRAEPYSDTVSIFLCVLAFGVHHKPDKDSPRNADKQIHKVEGSEAVLAKAAVKAVCKMKAALPQSVSSRGEPHRRVRFCQRDRQRADTGAFRISSFLSSGFIAIPPCPFSSLCPSVRSELPPYLSE